MLTFGIKVMMESVIAPNRLFMATPIKITVPLEAFHFRAQILTNITAKKAPRKAERDTTHPPYIPNAAQMVTASPAPELTPMMFGEANLFARTPCIITPATASANPQKMVDNTRGKRT